MAGRHKERRTAIKAAKRDLDGARKAYSRRVKDARKALADAERTHNRVVSETRRALNNAEKSYDKGVRAAEKKLDAARTGQLLASSPMFQPKVRAYDNRIELPDTVAPLDRRIRATVQASGRKTKNKDSRQLYLTVDTPQFERVVKFNPDHQPQIRSLAAGINTAAKNADANLQHHAEMLLDAERNLEDVRRDRSAIDDAQNVLRTAEGDRDAIESAQLLLAEAEADSGDVDKRAAALLALDPTAKIRRVTPARARGLPASGYLDRAIVWWKDRSKKAKAGLILAAILALLIGLGSVTEPESARDEAAPNVTATDTTESAPPPPTLSVETPRPKAKPRTYLVTEVIDGDTIVLENGAEIRLIQIDAPEVNGSECFSARSAATLESILRPGITRVRLRFDPRLDQVDRYNRRLAYVFKGKELVNLTLVRRGVASVWFFEGERGRYAGKLLAAARNARALSRGFWKVCSRTELDPTRALATRRPPPPPRPEPVQVAQPAPAQSACDPNYAGACVPPYPPDVDCADVGTTVNVVGSDPHGLDGDNDGYGCE